MILNVNDFDSSFIKKTSLVKRNKGKQKNKRRYKNLIFSFDIEATNINELEQSIMYIWQLDIDNRCVVIGRTWIEFLNLLEKISSILKEDEYVVFYVHNLSYEFQFLKGIYAFDSSEVFATESRRILKCEMFDHIEFRCSYYLTNSSLDKFLKKMNVENKKLSYDYSKRRFHFTKLTSEELAYCINDVVGLTQGIKKLFELENLNLHTTPLTATGFPRNDVKKNFQGYNMLQIRKELPNYEIQLLLEEAFRGGDTHASRWYANEVIEDVYSYDIVSSYPAIMLLFKFPIRKFIKERPYFERLIQLYRREYPFITRFVVTNLRLRDKYYGNPYLSRSKCRYIQDGYYDNGRILQAKMLETTMTDIDWKIFSYIYDFDEIIIKDLYSSKYGELPKPLTDTIFKYYKIKTELKNSGNDYEYNRAKEKLNACYGMMVQNPIKQMVLYDDEKGYYDDDKDEKELLEKANKKAYLNFSWGVWVSAYGRYQLFRLMKMIHESPNAEWIYSDTDSCKFFGEVDFEDFNKEMKELAISKGMYAKDSKGNIQYVGVVELDGIYKKFRTNGAKKYAYVDKDDKLHITIAGVNKTLGAVELAERGGLEKMNDGFVFKKGGGTESKYNDENLGLVKLKEGEVDLTSNIYIKNSEYTLGSTADYIELLTNVQKLKYCDLYMKGIYERQITKDKTQDLQNKISKKIKIH